MSTWVAAVLFLCFVVGLTGACFALQLLYVQLVMPGVGRKLGLDIVEDDRVFTASHREAPQVVGVGLTEADAVYDWMKQLERWAQKRDVI